MKRKSFSGMWLNVSFVRTGLSEERADSFFGMENSVS
jgi:hypothetical protein